jgi:hypothetical protein
MKLQLSLVTLLALLLARVAQAEDWQPEPGFKSLFNSLSAHLGLNISEFTVLGRFRRRRPTGEYPEGGESSAGVGSVGS